VDDEALAAALRALELELHRGDTRANRARMEALLHAEFIEVGRSGTLWTREATLAEFAAGGESAPRILADRFAMRRLADGLVLLTYRSAHVDADGRRSRFTWRSSLWQHGAAGWQLRFHQGTPTEDDTP
jgi:hypothetical protein